MSAPPPAPPPPPLRRYAAPIPRPLPSNNRREFFEEQRLSQEESLPRPAFRYTKYFWTINSQRAAYTVAQAETLKKLLAEAALRVFIRGSVVAFAHPNHEYNRIYIGENVLQMVIEIGEKHHRVHLHMIQHLSHRSVINIDPKDVKRELEEEVRETTGLDLGFYVCKRSHESELPLLAYVDKSRNDYEQTGAIPRGIWTYSWSNDGRTDTWQCNHPLRRFNGTVEHGDADDHSYYQPDDDDFGHHQQPPTAAVRMRMTRRERELDALLNNASNFLASRR
jgi:hypothetical protein